MSGDNHMSSFVQRVHVSTLLKDAMVTDMVWGNKSDRLFFGDDQGRLAVSYMPKVCSRLDAAYSDNSLCVVLESVQEAG